MGVIPPIPSSAAFPGRNGKIYYSRIRHGRAQIYRINPDGSHRKRLTFGRGQNFSPAASPDGKRVAYVRNRKGNEDVFLMHANGSHKRRLTSNRATDWSPAFSPDGRKLLFTSRRRNRGRFELFRMRLADKHVARLTWQTNYAAPTYSPDGKTIAYAARGSHHGHLTDNTQIWEMNANGHQRHQLTHDSQAFVSQQPDYSPSGNRIVFTRQPDYPGDRFHLWSMNADGTDQHRIKSQHEHQRGRVQYSPTYSPDGRWIAYWEYLVPNATPREWSIVVMRPNGSHRHALPHSAFGSDPTWAPSPR